MYKYFQMLEQTAKRGKVYNSIKELTIDLAKSGGYRRHLYEFKNKNVRERTVYDKKFDDVLVAKWLCFYKKLFFAKLSQHPELSEYYIQVIDKTLYMVMSCLNMEKLTCDDIVNKYVNLALTSRVAEAMYLTKSKYSPVVYDKNNIRNFVYKSAIDNQAISLDELREVFGDSVFDIVKDNAYTSNNVDEVVIELEEKLKNNPYGKRLLDALLNCTKKMSLSAIDKYVQIKDSEKNEQTATYIADAYNIIKTYLIDAGCVNRRIKKTRVSSVRFSEERVS